MPQQDAIIVGAGISGMSLAHYFSKNGLKPLVIDKNGRLGGTFNSYRMDNFWFELGAHSCYNSYGNLVDLLNDTGCLDKIIKPGSAGYKLFTGGEIKSIMSQMSFLELAVSLPKLFSMKMDGETVEAYYSGIVGKKNFERAMGPMFNAVICQSANAFPADMLFKKRARRKEVIKKFSLPGGIQTIIEAIAAAPAIETATGKDVTEIMFDSDVFKVTASDGSSYESKRLALATPSEAAAKMLQKSFPDISKKLSMLKAEKVETVGVIIKKDATKIGLVAALAATDDIFYSFVSRDTFPDPLYRAFAFHFKSGMTSHETKLGRIAQVLGTREFEKVVTAEHVIPSLRLGHKNTIAEIDGMIAGTSLLLTGNYFTGLAIEDCVSRSLQEYRRLTR
jgi:oxygen-dependent protoporphyrinogen oxidase